MSFYPSLYLFLFNRWKIAERGVNELYDLYLLGHANR